MRTSTLRTLRRGAALLMAGSGVALLVVSPVLAQSDEVRTTTDLFGYDLEADASPVSVRIFENFIPIPTDPGDPQFEITASYSATNLGTGPNGRAVASSIWPGAAVGDGFGTLAGDESQSYPIRAAARYPGRGEENWSQQTTVDELRAGMYAEARGLDVVARSEGGGVPPQAAPVVSYGQVRSEAISRVVDGQAVSRTLATITDLRLLEGLIRIDSVTTELGATSDGETSATSGRTTVGGIEVLGLPVRLTDQGAVIVPDGTGEDAEGDEEGDEDPLQPLQDLLGPVNTALQQLTDDLVADGLEDVLGIRIEALDHRETLEGAIAERVAEGVSITIDLAVLRGYLDPLLDVVPLGELLEQLPEDEEGNVRQVKGLIFELLGLGPRIQYVVGSGFVAASASPAFEMPDLPALPPPPALPPVSGGTMSSPTLPSSGVSLPPPGSSGSAEVPSASVAPPASSPSVAPPAPAADPMEPFGGVPVAAVGLSLLFGAIPTFGMRSVRDAAVGLGASTELPRPLPDLRGGA